MKKNEFENRWELIQDNKDHLNQYYAITPMQQQLWIAQQTHSNSTAYTESRAIKLEGDLNIKKLEECITEIIKRHEILRTTFHQVDGQIMQKVEQPFNFKINHIDFRDEPSYIKKVKVKQAKEELEKRIWNTERLPLFYLSVIQIKDDLFWLIFNFNHIIMDAFSIVLFSEELEDLYNSQESSDLKKAPLQFIDYTLWINQFNADISKKTSALNFFKSYLANNEPVYFHLAKKDFTEITSFKSESFGYELPIELAVNIANFANTHRYSKFIVMLSVFFLLVSRHSTSEEITVGLPIITRYDPRLLKTLGLFLNNTVISQKIDVEMTFLDFVKLIQSNWKSVEEYSSYPYSEIVKELKPKHTANRNPYFDILFNYLPNRYNHIWRSSGLTQKCQDMNTSETELFLTWYIYESSKEGLGVGCKTILEMLDAKTINLLFWQYQSLLEQVIQNPNKQLKSYSLLFREDLDSYHRSLSKDPDQWADYSNYTFYSDQVKLPHPAHEIIEKELPLVPYMISNHAKSIASLPAIIVDTQQWCYADLECTAYAIANKLIMQGISKGSVVAIHGEMSFGLCASVIGVWLAGGVILLIDSSYPVEYKQMLVDVSQAKSPNFSVFAAK